MKILERVLDKRIRQIVENEELRFETASRINATWMKWRFTAGIPCDRRIDHRFKSKIYRNVIRPIALCGCEYWPTIKEKER